MYSTAENGHIDEVNFWRPLAQSEFKALVSGQPFFFRLKHPHNAIAGYGYFAHATRIPVQLAWDIFGQRNGDPNFEKFLNRIAEYRGESPMETLSGAKDLTCLVLREARFLPRKEWMAWTASEQWSSNIVAIKGYDLAEVPGQLLAQILQNGRPPEFVEDFELASEDMRTHSETQIALREGQGAFRVRLLDAYQRRCAVTGERSMPVLEAAHIQPYRGPSSNHLQNGLVLRADIHKLYDRGYVTVTPDYRFEVSSRLREEFDNGDVYYSLAGNPLAVVPVDRGKRPSRKALDWHASNIFW